MPELGGRGAQSSPQQGKAELDFICGFLKRFVLLGCFLQGLARVVWLEKPGSEGVELRLVLVISKALFLGQSSPGFTGMAEVGQNYLEERLNVGRRSCWRGRLVERGVFNVLVSHSGGRVPTGFSFFAAVVLPPCRKCEILGVFLEL